MASQKEYEERIRSYRKRIDDELELIKMNLPGFDDNRNTPSSYRVLAQHMRRSLDKINSYFHNIEMIVEREYNDKESDRQIDNLSEQEEVSSR